MGRDRNPVSEIPVSTAFAGSVLTALMKIRCGPQNGSPPHRWSELQPQIIDLKRLSRRMSFISLGYQFGC
jgi:hypothetical protein